MNSLYVIRLKRDGFQVVLLSFSQVIGLVPTESSVVIGLEMVRVKINCPTVVGDCSVKVALLAVGEPSVVVEVSLSRFDLNGRCEALDRFVEVAAPIQRYTLIVVSVGVLRVNPDRSCIVCNGQTELAEFVVGKTTIEKCLEMVWVNIQGLRVEHYRCLVVTLLASSIALGMESLSLCLQLWVNLDVERLLIHLFLNWI